MITLVAGQQTQAFQQSKAAVGTLISSLDPAV